MGENVTIAFGTKSHNANAKFLLPVIRGWRKAIDSYVKEWSGTDAPYHNNERANVGSLAGGAWLNGWSVLEEYPNPKKKNKKAKRASGRVDLYVRKRKRQAIFEAKHSRINATKITSVELNQKIKF